MPLRFVSVLAIFALFAAPALAGDVTISNGKTAWQSTQCKIPAPPSSLANNPETPANDLNARVAAFNAFTQDVQAYAACMSREAEHDANAASEAIVAAAQAVIDQEQKKAAALAASLRATPPEK
jgi:hypothetical protein